MSESRTQPGVRIALDPTENVRNTVVAAEKRLDDLREAESKRLDDLREAESRRVDQQVKFERRHISEIMYLERQHRLEVHTLARSYGAELTAAEAKRIDAIRAVDVNAVAVASERAAAQATVLANQVSSSAETLRTLVQTTAQNNTQQQDRMSAQIMDRIKELEKAQYTGAGKSGGIKDLWGWIVALIMLAIAVAGFVVPHLK